MFYFRRVMLKRFIRVNGATDKKLYLIMTKTIIITITINNSYYNMFYKHKCINI